MRCVKCGREMMPNHQNGYLLWTCKEPCLSSFVADHQGHNYLSEWTGTTTRWLKFIEGWLWAGPKEAV